MVKNLAKFCKEATRTEDLPAPRSFSKQKDVNMKQSGILDGKATNISNFLNPNAPGCKKGFPPNSIRQPGVDQGERDRSVKHNFVLLVQKLESSEECMLGTLMKV